MKNSAALPYIMLTFCALFWAGSSVVGRHVVGEIPPLALNFWRWLFAFLIVLTWTWRELYDHRNDTAVVDFDSTENVNVARDPANGEVVQQLTGAAHRFFAEGCPQ